MASACNKETSSTDGKKVAEMETRLASLEKKVASFDEIKKFLEPIMQQQKAEDDRRAASEPDPNAMFAVDISGNAFDGPAGAAVTIIEAFDFA